MSIKRNLGYLASALLLLVLFSACAQDAMTEAEIKALVQAEVDKQMGKADQGSLENRLVELQLESFCMQFDISSLYAQPTGGRLSQRKNFENLAGCAFWEKHNDSTKGEVY